MLRICKDGKKKYVGLGLPIRPTEWDFSKNQPKPEHTDSERLKVIISEIIAKYNKKILELTAKGEEFTAASLVDAVNTRKQKQSESYFLNTFSNLMKKDGVVTCFLSNKPIILS